MAEMNRYKEIRYDDGRKVTLTMEGPPDEPYRLTFSDSAGIVIRSEYFTTEEAAIAAFEKEKKDPTF